MKDPPTTRPARRAGRLLGALLGLSIAGPGAALAEEAKKLPEVTYNPELKTFEHILPHRTEFRINITQSGVDAEYDSVVASYWKADGACGAAPADAPTVTGGAEERDTASGKRKYTVPIPKLSYSTGYCFAFRFERGFTDADKAAVEAAMSAAFKAAAKKGSYDEKLLRGELEASLGQRAKSLAKASADPKKPGTPLLDLLVRTFLPREAFAPNGHFNKTFEAWNRYHDEDENLRTQLRQLVILRPTEEGVFGAPKPAEFDRYYSLFGALVTKVDAIKLDQALPERQRITLRLDEPAPMKTEVAAIREQVELLHDQAVKVKAGVCSKAADDKQRAFCNDKVEPAITASQKTKERFDGIAAAQKDYGELKAKSLADVKARVAGFRATTAPEHAATVSATYTERSTLYISADVGMMVPIFIGGGVDVAPFFGINIYFTGVDKDVPLRSDDGFLKRFSLTGGITLKAIRDDQDTVEGIVNGNALMGGAGLRITDYLRIGGGAVILRQKDQNPLATATKHVRVAPYAALSIDVDVAGIVTKSYANFK